MKRFYFLLYLLMLGPYIELHAQIDTSTIVPYEKLVDTLFSKLDHRKIPSGILIDRAYRLVNDDNLNGKNTDYTTELDTLLELYSELYYGHWRYDTLKTVFAWDSLAKQYTQSSGNIPLFLIHQRYHRIKPNAFEKKWLTIENKQLVDHTGGGTPFEEKHVFAMAPLTKTLSKRQATFVLPDFLVCASHKIDRLEIDFDDGKGFRRLSVNEPIDVAFSHKKEAIIMVRAIDHEDTLLSQSKVLLPMDYIIDRIPEHTLNDVPNQTITLAVNGKDHEYGVWLGCDNFYLRKPVIIVEGYDPTNRRYVYVSGAPEYPNKDWDTNLYSVANEQKMADKLRNAGYDIVILNFADGLDPLEDQAQVVEALIREVNRKLAAVGSYHELVIIGPSSGGIIARYALAEMEGRGEDHNTRLYISFDAPHQGANVPLGLQHLMVFLSRSFPHAWVKWKTVEQIKDVFYAKPTKQLLVYHASKTDRGEKEAKPADEFGEFFTNLNSLNGGKGYPVKCRKVAIANGSGSGMKQNAIDPGTQLFAINLIYGLANVVTSGWALPDNSGVRVFHGVATFLGIITNYANVWVNNTKPYDGAPGGKGDFVAKSVEQIGGRFTDCKATSCDQQYEDFIPTISALDLRNTTDLFYNVHANLTGGKNEAFALGSSITPFDAIFVSSTNTKHVIEGLTPEIAAFVCDEVMPMNLYIQNRSIVGNKEFEGLQSITIGQNVSSRYASGSVNIISNSGTITFRAGETISLQSGTSITANGGSVGFKLTRFASCGAACRIAYEEDVHSQYSTYQEPITQIASAKSNNYFNYPNPFNDHTHIAYTLNKMAYVKMDIFNMWGQLISTLVNEQQEVGEHVVAFDASKLLSGVYMCRLVIDGELYTIKMICHKQ